MYDVMLGNKCTGIVESSFLYAVTYWEKRSLLTDKNYWLRRRV